MWYDLVTTKNSDGSITFKSCASVDGGYFYILKPDGSRLGQVIDVPIDACRTDTIAASYFTQPGTYLAKVADYNNFTWVTQTIQIAGTTGGTQQTATAGKELVFSFTGQLPATLSASASEVIRIMSDVLSNLTGGTIGNPYYEGTDKLVFTVGSMGTSSIEGFIASSPKFISLIRWFASLAGIVYVSSYIRDVATGITTAVTSTATNSTIDNCLSSNISDSEKANCVRQALNLAQTQKPTDWSSLIGLAAGAIIIIYVLQSGILTGGKK